MIFSDLAAGDSIFLDANTLTYHFQPHPVLGLSCTDLLERIERQERLRFASTHVLSETAHRLTTLEACGSFGWPFARIAQRLRQHPAQVKTLVHFRQAIEQIPRYRVQLLPIPIPLIEKATEVSQQSGLLHRDALIVAVMQANGLTKLASHDADFERVPGLTRYAPV